MAVSTDAGAAIFGFRLSSLVVVSAALLSLDVVISFVSVGTRSISSSSLGGSASSKGPAPTFWCSTRSSGRK